MGRVADRLEAIELENILQGITDDRVRYFYMMLGDAIAHASREAKDGAVPVQANTGPAQIADLAARLNKS